MARRCTCGGNEDDRQDHGPAFCGGGFIGSAGEITRQRLGRLMIAQSGALIAGSLTPEDVASFLSDIGMDLAYGRLTVT